MPPPGRPAGRHPTRFITAARSSASPSTHASTRRMVASSGTGQASVRTSQRPPKASSAPVGTSAAHSPTATSEVAPASTAAAASARTYTKAWRTPRRERGSGTAARHSSRPGHSSRASAPTSCRWPRAGGIREDTATGTVFFAGHVASGTTMIAWGRACLTIRPQLYPRNRTNPTTRHYAEALASPRKGTHVSGPGRRTITGQALASKGVAYNLNTIDPSADIVRPRRVPRETGRLVGRNKKGLGVGVYADLHPQCLGLRS